MDGLAFAQVKRLRTGVAFIGRSVAIMACSPSLSILPTAFGARRDIYSYATRLRLISMFSGGGAGITRHSCSRLPAMGSGLRFLAAAAALRACGALGISPPAPDIPAAQERKTPVTCCRNGAENRATMLPHRWLPRLPAWRWRGATHIRHKLAITPTLLANNGCHRACLIYAGLLER